jgi:hypothetical protein
MRQLMLAAGVACAVVAVGELADAQVNTMPGQVVGTGYGLGSVGQAVPKAAPQAGTPINLPSNSKMVRRYDPNNPYDALNGTSYSKDQVVAPVTPLSPLVEHSFLSKMKTILGFDTPSQPVPRSTYFPSLTRRNRERNEAKQWRRD